ncbi:MAG: RidA family protein [Chloroflexi bacterium]|nr:RidA family protein [Chloroflexota bacterium]
MEKIRKNYPDIAPSGATFSRGVRAGNTLYIAGCTARGTEAQGQSMMEQLQVTLDRIVRIVAEEGGSPSDIVKITTFVTSIPDWRADRERQEALFAEFFQGDYPANTLVEITALAEDGLDVEIEAIVELG